MTKNLMPKVLKYIGLALAILTALFLLNCNHVLAGIVTLLLPAAYPWVFAALLLIEAAAFYWLWQAWFNRPDHLAFDVTDFKARKQLENMLVERLCENFRSIKDAEQKKDTPNRAVIEECVVLLNKKTDPMFVEDCLKLLNKKANEEIQSTAKRIFLATALSQNGRIDTIIVFVGLCRMVWRISSIYNQKPHPSEVFRLYKAVATATFLAFSIEELNIATEISTGFGELLKAAAPATMARAVPIVGHTFEKITASAIDGAANCFLALRTGIITRNTFAYVLTVEERPSRTVVFKEAGGMLLSITSTPLKDLAGTAKDTFAGVVQDVVDGVENAIQTATSKAIETIEIAKEKAVDETQKATETIRKAGDLAKASIEASVESIKRAGASMTSTAQDLSTQLKQVAVDTGVGLTTRVAETKQAVQVVVDDATKAIQAVEAKAAQTIADSGTGLKESMQEFTKNSTDFFKRTRELLSWRPFNKKNKENPTALEEKTQDSVEIAEK